MFIWAVLFIMLAIMTATFAFGQESGIGLILFIEAVVGLGVISYLAFKRDRKQQREEPTRVGPAPDKNEPG